MVNAFVKGLCIPQIAITPDTPFPHDQPGKAQLQQLARGGAVAVAHLLPTQINLSLLDHYLDKMVLNIRDPRQIALSYTHHVLKLKELEVDPTLLTWMKYFLPDHFFEFSFEKQLNWSIDYVIPNLMNMLTGWLAVENNSKTNIEVLITQFKDFKADSTNYFKGILDFYQIPHQHFTFPQSTPATEGSMYGDNPNKNQSNFHFRKGTLNEWMDIMTLEQKKRATAFIPSDLLERFGWARP